MKIKKANNVNVYAMQILAENGCDCHTYWNCDPEELINDLKERYPKGMQFPYVEVANAILEITRAPKIIRKKYKVAYNTENFCDATKGTDDLKEAMKQTINILKQWIEQYKIELELTKQNNGTKEEIKEIKESWNSMIENCWAEVQMYNETKDEYETCWTPTSKELKQIGWQYKKE